MIATSQNIVHCLLFYVVLFLKIQEKIYCYTYKEIYRPMNVKILVVDFQLATGNTVGKMLSIKF